jgi:hypothetical protein
MAVHICNTSYSGRAGRKIRPAQGKNTKPCPKDNKAKMTRGMTQVVECPSSKCKVLVQIPVQKKKSELYSVFSW